MMANLLKALVPMLVVKCCMADVYMIYPRGSNNRLNGQNRNRQNNNRVCDTQNNNRGGVNVADRTANRANNEEQQFSETYFGGSTLPVKFLAQHGMNIRNLQSTVIVQTKCQPVTQPPTRLARANRMRDGTSTQTQQFNRNSRQEGGVGTVQRNRAMQESYEEYRRCAKTARNQGLFTADQLQGNGRNAAINTRQNPNGGRSGLECPEERDYYPYWRASDWWDTVILTDDTTKCAALVRESFNNKPKWLCDLPAGTRNNVLIPNNREDCEARGGTWGCVYHEAPPTVGGTTTANVQNCRPYDPTRANQLTGAIPARIRTGTPPECLPIPKSEENHNGVTDKGNMATYDMAVPRFATEQSCVTRLRYNMSIIDVEGLDASRNSEFDDNNPNIQYEGVRLQLAINTAQTGRTFQDRSHKFIVSPPPPTVPRSAKIRNLNVIGKRGNNQQVYPSIEYGFSTDNLRVSTNEFIHIQWAGSNSNPQNNAGNGRRGTDRSNIVGMRNAATNLGLPMAQTPLFRNMVAVDAANGRRLPWYRAAMKLATSDYPRPRNNGNNGWLDNSPASTTGVVARIMRPGTYNYMSTRNNNFSNRSQKGAIVVSSGRRIR